jgi:hypothetical protein
LNQADEDHQSDLTQAGAGREQRRPDRASVEENKRERHDRGGEETPADQDHRGETLVDQDCPGHVALLPPL